MARKRGAPSAPQKSKDKGSKAKATGVTAKARKAPRKKADPFEPVRKRAQAAANATANRLDRENRRSGLFRGGI